MEKEESIKCLIVEDDYFVANYFKEAISQFSNVNIMLANNGEEALKIFSEEGLIDILITDLNMPKLTGEELIKRIREISPQTLIIVITGYATISNAVSLVKQGVFDYLTKPIELDTLIDALKRALNQVRLIKEQKGLDNIGNVWNLSRLIEKDLSPTKILENMIYTAIKVTKGQGGGLFFRIEENKWEKIIFKNIENGLADEILKEILKNLGPWTGIKQEEVHASLLKVIERDNLKYICAPFISENKVRSILIVSINPQEIGSNTLGLLAVFCNQLYPIVNMCLQIYKLLKTHEKVIKVNSDLKKLHEELKQSTKLACLGELAAGIVHEINTPLTCIIGFIKLFLKFLEKPDITLEKLLSIKHYLEKACNEAERCQQILNEFLRFSKKESKRFNKFLLNKVVDSVLALLEEQFKKKNIEIIKQIEDKLYLVGDENQIKQVLINILVNAKNAMPKGGKITIKGKIFKENIKLEIEDTGIGIPKENISKIFEPFYTTNMGGKGTGLGLSISKKIVEEHGGKIEVISEVGKGSTFILQFPCN